MSDQHPVIEDAVLGTLTRATTTLDDGTVVTHEWYAGSVTIDGEDLDLMIEGVTAEDAGARLPRMREVMADIESVRRRATDAVVTAFSTGDPEPHELDEAASDLILETLEASADGDVVLHLIDGCGTHFPEGYWPAVHIGADGAVVRVAVES